MDAKQGQLELFKTLLHMCCCEWRIAQWIMDRIKASSLTKSRLTRLTLKTGNILGVLKATLVRGGDEGSKSKKMNRQPSSGSQSRMSPWLFLASSPIFYVLASE